MTPPSVVEQFRLAWLHASRSQRVRWLLLIGAGATLLLLIYCLGHGAFSAQPSDWLMSLQWSVAHAIGLISLLAITTIFPKPQPAIRFTQQFVAALAASALSFAILRATQHFEPFLHDYVSIGVWALIAALLTPLLAPLKPWQALNIDFGQHRQLVAIEQLIAVHGARNYVEIEIIGKPGSGIVRSTIKEFLQSYPTALLQCHRSHLINPKQVTRIQPIQRGAYQLTLSNGSIVPVSAAYADRVLATCHFVPATENPSQSAVRS
ncbi:LytTR family DNA-binding domain-containing protein [Permianibacter aggregans]|uniref:LytTr DNA-binding domain-containing protein n=1 Tax=Permianibacter aggregans TaxID=1510150 RepID=A0A4R6UNR5_9GAMM|nr:LytTR family DNA-binding domain-containing protein [Permianibacter aggregans]TDQ48462.1 LytTr DNA-binding domain-containing protein [Permianibacter aggregans]